MAKRIIQTVLLLFSFFSLEGLENSNQIVKRVHSHLIIKDLSSACLEAEEGLLLHPTCQPLWEAYIQSLTKSGREKDALKAWGRYVSLFPEESQNRILLEHLAWGIIEEASRSSSPITRLFATLGATFSQDAKGITILFNHLTDPNSFIRAVTVQLASEFRDAKLQEGMVALFKKENIWKVRLEIIKALGKMKIKRAHNDLVTLLANDKSSAEEKSAAIESLANLLETAQRSEVEKLAKSDRAGLRLLACQLVSVFDLHESLDLIAPLIDDHRAEVRRAALKVFGHLKVTTLNEHSINEHSIVDKAEKRLEDVDFQVRIAAAWFLTLHDAPRGHTAFQTLLTEGSEELQLQAAAALSACGKHGFPLILNQFRQTKNHFLKMNLAFGLLGQRIETEAACSALFEGLTEEKKRWMWIEDEFHTLAPSKLKYDETIPNYPEEVNQLVRLEVLSVLAIFKYPKAQEAIKRFLQERTWGVSGLASALLLTEGDESSIELVQELLKDPQPKVRIQAALILALWGEGENALSVLQEAYATADRDLKERILEGVGRIGSLNSIAFLVEKLGEPYQNLRVIAASALLQCLYH